MPPKAQAPAPWTMMRARPRIAFALTKDFWHTGRQGKYQVTGLWWIGMGVALLYERLPLPFIGQFNPRKSFISLIYCAMPSPYSISSKCVATSVLLNT